MTATGMGAAGRAGRGGLLGATATGAGAGTTGAGAGTTGAGAGTTAAGAGTTDIGAGAGNVTGGTGGAGGMDRTGVGIATGGNGLREDAGGVKIGAGTGAKETGVTGPAMEATGVFGASGGGTLRDMGIAMDGAGIETGGTGGKLTLAGAIAAGAGTGTGVFSGAGLDFGHSTSGPNVPSPFHATGGKMRRAQVPLVFGPGRPRNFTFVRATAAGVLCFLGAYFFSGRRAGMGLNG